mmetsp:Transcript_25/g.59  ORF Transcript_25/g.59 Transcript_25/m.59 type:complete len:504 (-) Transcript_25:54-1565(-)
MVMRGVVVLFLVLCLSSVVVVQHVQGAKYNTAGFNNDAALQRENDHDEGKDATLFTRSLTERAMQVMDDASLHEDDDDVNSLSFANNGILHENILNLFREWIGFHGKTYGDEQSETLFKRFKAFKENIKYIHENNKNERNKSYTLGLNAFADLSLEEFQRDYLGVHPEKGGQLPSRALIEDSQINFVPGAVPGNLTKNWVEEGAVSEVKNQGRCGSCWSFSTTGAIEGINAIVSGKLVSLSEQELVDCDTEHDHGCQGGLMDFAFEFVEEHGLDTEKDYPYQGVQSVCDTARENRVVVTIDGHEDIPAGDEQEMVKAASKHPISVAIQANHQNFQLYTGGVFDDPECGTQLDHGVLVVGFGTSSEDQDYWIMKNSWGPLWGEEGYMKMAMGIEPSGICGIAKMSSYPTKTSVDPPAPPPTPPSPTPPPAPKVVCNQVQSCEAKQTCCCMLEFQQCLVYSCCPYENAVCCDDKQSCCPSGTKCNTEAGTCESADGISSIHALLF